MKSKSYQTILFDWDGCLAKTLQVWLAAYKDTFAKYDIQLTNKEIATKAFGDWRASQKHGIEDFDKFNKQLLATANQKIKRVDLYKGVKQLLGELKKNDKQLALLSSSVRNFIEPALLNHGINNMFDLLIDGNEVKKHKPDPEIINIAINKLDANRATTIMVGDSKSDLGAAQAAKIDSLLFYPNDHNIFYDEKFLMSFNPTYKISEFSQAGDILL